MSPDTAAEAAERAAESALPNGWQANSEVKRVRLAELKVDHDYQREVSMPLVEQIRNNWDEIASELITVSRRQNGDLYIVNGQHRAAAAKMKGEKAIWGRIIDGLSPAQEAWLRLQTNVRKGDSSLDRFRASLHSGDEEALAIVKLLGGFELEVNRTPTVEGGINCISTVEDLYQVDDGVILKETFVFLKQTFKQLGGRYATAALLRGVAWFLGKHADEANVERMAEIMRGYGIAAFDRRARAIQTTMGGTLWLNYYRAMVDLYNEGLTEKNKLEWRTRGATARAGRYGR